MVLGQLITSLQTIVSRNISTFDSLCSNYWRSIVWEYMECDCDQAYVQGTVRSFKPEVQDYIEQRFKEIAKGLEQLFNVDIEVIYTKSPGTVLMMRT